MTVTSPTTGSVTEKSARSAESRRSPVLGRFPVPSRILGYTVVATLGLLYLMPFVIQLVTGFKTDPDAAAHPLGLVPTTPTTAAYQRLFGLSEAGDGVPFLRWLATRPSSPSSSPPGGCCSTRWPATPWPGSGFPVAPCCSASSSPSWRYPASPC